MVITSKSGDVDILSIDSDIKKHLSSEYQHLPEYKLKLKEVNKVLQSPNLKPSVRIDLENSKFQLESQINDVENNSKLYFYMAETSELINTYKTILQTPQKISFIGKKKPINSEEKQAIINNYISVSKKYSPKYISSNDTVDLVIRDVCNYCSNKILDIVDTDTYVCIECANQQMGFHCSLSYRDIDRVNMTNKYQYDRKIHFKDCINQYQGKQNSNIPAEVYTNLEKQFKLHHLLVGDENTPKRERFKNITKEHISIFLKELSYTKQYENINLIHYNITGKKPDDIGYLENQLMEDFDALAALYDKRFKNSIDRKSFINTQYVLFQLLTRHKHTCKREDFSMLKTLDRQSFHDDICRVLFEELGWNHISFY